MAIEKTVSELAEILGVSRQAINNRVKALPPENTEKNEKGVTVVTRSQNNRVICHQLSLFCRISPLLYH